MRQSTSPCLRAREAVQLVQCFLLLVQCPAYSVVPKFGSQGDNRKSDDDEQHSGDSPFHVLSLHFQ